ncbi:MFS transporter [Xylophilus ampelinus]|uniref:Putative MFS family arabinose efflux permease n=1 Tax=Xylophilus ampelinus TaxID=54067 RepID=A0A318SL55_9BURK|nr:MFS transporter [Xylophilus ampelinus]MCS4509461.1 MFS transporter [Xylophilus ampelinus]PYE79190.1 putative MFS family arabinose efflux permease [Xylophilus ampelinus]
MSGVASLRGARALGASRHATRVQFFCSGFLFATWGVHIPTVRALYGVTEAGLGVAMLAAGIGALLGLPQAGRLIARYGPRGVCRVCGVTMAGGVSLLLVMPGLPALLMLLAVFGVANGIFDVAINAEAAELERVGERPLMSGMHGMFSTGGMVGAGVGGVLLAWPQGHLTLVAVVLAAAVLLAAQRMLVPLPIAADAPRIPGFVLPRGTLLVLGVFAGLGLIAEGAMYDWSVLYLHQELGSPQAEAAWAYASFSAAMAAARFGGDWVRARVAPAVLLRASALVAAFAMVVVLLAAAPRVALVGFALAGIGFANVVPLLFTAAAKVPGGSPAHAIAAVSSLGYLGFMGGPPIIGFVAQGNSLGAALWLVVVFAVVLAVGARRALN